MSKPGAATRRPGLVAEVLLAQLAVAIAVGLASLIGFTVITSAVVEANLLRWASSWANQLDELGAPLYVGDKTAALVDLDRFIASYPEVVQVALYAPDGTRIVAVDNGTDGGDGGDTIVPLAALDAEQIAALEPLAKQAMPGVLTEDLGGRRFLLHGPIIVESLAGADLLDFDPDETQGSTEILGFVSLELDFSAYLSALWPRLVAGAVVIAILIVIGWVLSRLRLKRALEPLAGLEKPLHQIGRGEMDVELPRPRHRELATIVNTLRETIEALKQREARLRRLASRDALTGLYNRYRLMEELGEEIERCRNGDRTSALLFIDLDQFKYVNDTGGHAAGDNLLVTAARQIIATVREQDFVARFGGDEFIVLLRDIARRDARKVADQVLESMRRVTHHEGDSVFNLQCSIGLAHIGSGRHDPEEILAHGDLACQAAKRHGRNRVEAYRIASRQDVQMAEDVRWMQRIREALAGDHFVLHFQPLMHIATGEIYHYEALLRMRTDDGLIGPATFLPAAARFGLMSAIDLWVIERAIRSLADAGPGDNGGLKLSANVSGFALEETELVPRIRDMLSNYGVSGNRLVLELTEHIAVRFASETDDRLQQLRSLGLAIAIDDFGTGYSSFSYLKRLPVDYLKIDGSFVRNLARDKVDQAMVRMTGELAREIGLSTVAEYVQNEAAMKLLRKYGIDYAQGSYVGRAMPKLGTPVAEAAEA
jgi:diguanylate cyclase (GGDEF)-like protein